MTTLTGIQKRLRSAAWICSVLLSTAAANQRIPFQTCTVNNDTSRCIQVSDGFDTVGVTVTSLGELYRTCLEVDTLSQGSAPLRVILMLDESGSMCSKPPRCCGTGDGTLNCENNDPENRRIEASHLFVEELRLRSPASQVGILVYSNDIQSTFGPVSLDDPDNVYDVHRAINEGACGGSDCGEPCEFPTNGSAGKKLIQAPSLGKRLATYPGMAVDHALEMVDDDYDQMPANMARHIILLTDGAWDDVNRRSPAVLIENYRDDFPDRTVPVVHGVFISDSLTHVQHGYPAAGCSGGEYVDLTHLETITQLTGGYYFPGSTPQTIATQFLELLEEMVIEKQQQLASITITDILTGVSRQSSQDVFLQGSLNDYISSVPGFDLVSGENSFEIRRLIRIDDEITDTLLDTIHIFRDENRRHSTQVSTFEVACEVDTALLTITASPAIVVVDSAVEVRATIDPSDIARFAPDDITVRALTAFPDSDVNTAALFHLDGDLENVHGNDGSGDALFTSSEKLFGSGALSGESFSFSIPDDMNDYTLEFWVYPTGFETQQIVRNGQFTLGIEASGALFAAHGEIRLESTTRLDQSVWSHVALSRSGENAVLYINGLPVSDQVSFPEIEGGLVSVRAPSEGILDELRISTISRAYPSGVGSVLALEEAGDITWHIADAKSVGNSAVVEWTQWRAGEVSFALTRPVPGEIVVNLRQESSQEELRWSKNSNPVSFFIAQASATAELYDTNGEGHLDKISIFWNQPMLDTAMIDLQTLVRNMHIVNHQGRKIILTPGEIVATGPNSMDIFLKENKGEQLETGWTSASVSLNGPLNVSDIKDKAGPVIQKAIYYASARAENTDSLQVLFSEPVHCGQLVMTTPSNGYAYYQKSERNLNILQGATYPNRCSETFTLRTTLLLNGGQSETVNPGQDSIQLLTGTTDAAGNPPPDPGRRGPVEWGPGNDIQVFPLINPFKPMTASIPDHLLQEYASIVQGHTGGAIVLIWSKKPLTPQPDGSYGEVRAFDAVGNLIAKNIAVRESSKPGYYGFHWDGRNINGRIVGMGTYLFIISATDREGFESETKVKIGIIQ